MCSAAALTPLAIPSTLHDSLTARLDRLSPIKEIAQIGAAIGREFSYRLLEAVSPIKGEALLDALRQLMEAELIYGRGTPPKASYIFKHALVQDAAYSFAVARPASAHPRPYRAGAEGAHRRRGTSAGHHRPSFHRGWPCRTGRGRTGSAAAELALSQSAPAEAERHASAGIALIPRHRRRARARRARTWRCWSPAPTRWCP